MENGSNGEPQVVGGTSGSPQTRVEKISKSRRQGEDTTAQEKVEPSPKEKVELTDEEKVRDNKVAESEGWDNAPQALKSVKSWTGNEYARFTDIPEHERKFVSGVRKLIDQHTDPADAIKASYKYLEQAVKSGEITKEYADELASKVSESFTKKKAARGKLAEAVAETTKVKRAKFKQKFISEYNAIKEKFKSRIKGEKIGAKAVESKYKELRDSFNEFIKQAKSDKSLNIDEKNIVKMSKLINEIKNEKTLQKALDYISDVSVANDFADLKDKARTLRGRIKPKNFGTKSSEVAKFKEINPSDITDWETMQKYVDTAEALLRGKVGDVSLLGNIESITKAIKPKVKEVDFDSVKTYG